MIAVAGVPLETVGCLLLFALVVGLLIGFELARPYEPPSDRRRRQFDRWVDEHRIDR